MAPSYGNAVLFSAPIVKDSGPKRLHSSAPPCPSQCSSPHLGLYIVCHTALLRANWLHKDGRFKTVLKLTGTHSMSSPVFLGTGGLFSGVVTDCSEGQSEGIFMRTESPWDHLPLSHAFILSLSLSKGHVDFSNRVCVSLSHFLSPRPFLLLTKGVILGEPRLTCSTASSE